MGRCPLIPLRTDTCRNGRMTEDDDSEEEDEFKVP